MDTLAPAVVDLERVKTSALPCFGALGMRILAAWRDMVRTSLKAATRQRWRWGVERKERLFDSSHFN